MALEQETLSKLTTTLASDVDLYNEVIGEVQKADEIIKEKEQQLQTLEEKATQLEERANQYLSQISNLLSKIPVGESNAPQSIEQKIEEVKKRNWKK